MTCISETKRTHAMQEVYNIPSHCNFTEWGLQDLLLKYRILSQERMRDKENDLRFLVEIYLMLKFVDQLVMQLLA